MTAAIPMFLELAALAAQVQAQLATPRDADADTLFLIRIGTALRGLSRDAEAADVAALIDPMRRAS